MVGSDHDTVWPITLPEKMLLVHDIDRKTFHNMEVYTVSERVDHATPGPWIVDPPGNGTTIKHVIKGAGNAEVARGIENPADAQVIAAALEMRAALKKLDDLLDFGEPWSTCQCFTGVEEINAACAEARAALAKAGDCR